MCSRSSWFSLGHALGAKNTAPSSPAWYASLGRRKGPALNRSPTRRRAAEGSGSARSASTETSLSENIAATCSGLTSYPRLSFMSPTASARFSATGRPPPRDCDAAKAGRDADIGRGRTRRPRRAPRGRRRRTPRPTKPGPPRGWAGRRGRAPPRRTRRRRGRTRPGNRRRRRRRDGPKSSRVSARSRSPRGPQRGARSRAARGDGGHHRGRGPTRAGTLARPTSSRRVREVPSRGTVGSK